MKRFMTLSLTFIICIFSFWGLAGCIFNKENPYPYRGDYKELYSTAIYSIPNAEGYMHHGEGAYSPDIYIWEQDSYGRTLFSYCEDYGNQIFSLVICQSYDETNVYFYPDINYTLTLIKSSQVYESVKDDHLKNQTEAFYLENKDKLKEENDWNKPLDKAKCVSYAITDHKVIHEKARSLSSSECDEILSAYTKTLDLANPNNYPHRANSILQVDAEGKVLHEIYGVHQHHDNPNWTRSDEYTSYSIILWVITDLNGNYDKENGVFIMYSKANESNMSYVYNAKDILEFKKLNNWTN